jgi:hypothetical protein
VPLLYSRLKNLFSVILPLAVSTSAWAANDLLFIDAIQRAFLKNNEAILSEHGANEWEICETLVNGYQQGMARFIHVSSVVTARLDERISHWLYVLDMDSFQTDFGDVEPLARARIPKVVKDPEKIDAIRGLTSAVHFYQGLTVGQRQNELELLGRDEHPLFRVLFDIFDPIQDSHSVINSLGDLNAYNNGMDAELLYNYWVEVLRVIGSSEVAPGGGPIEEVLSPFVLN